MTNVNNTDGGTISTEVGYQLGITAPYRLKSAGSTWKNGGTQAAPTPVLVMPGTAPTLVNVSDSGSLVWCALCEQGIPPFTIHSTATGGTFTLTWNSLTTGTIAWNATAATVLTALAALAGWVSGGTTTGGPLNTTDVAIQQKTNAPLAITINAGSLTGGTATITNTTGQPFSPYTYLERNVTIAVDGEGTPAMQVSGTEEFFGGGGYFQSSPGYSVPWAMVTAANNAAATVDQGLDLLTYCGGVPFSTRFIWALGTEAAVQAAHQMSYQALYYKNV
jgi:predicted nuclease with RNAse H fold